MTLRPWTSQANARRACVEAERLRSEMEEARGLIEGQAALLEQLDHERRKCGDLEGQLTSASGALERERRQRVSDEDQHVQSLRKAEATQASLKAAAEVIRERMDAQSSEVAFLKEQQAHTLSQLQVLAASPPTTPLGVSTENHKPQLHAAVCVVKNGLALP